ncbi:uncharacterized protein [Diabrotica undecimpunctata]|uniref:uncharacterized protein n=1 Tax=Diabrotica undecimpunctata TaxID=50387 RepID=UPI003B6386D0
MSDTDSANDLAIPLSPSRKRTKKNHLSLEMKEVILNVYKNEVIEHPTTPLRDIQKIVGNKVGVCGTSVFNVIKEYKTTNKLTAPKTNKNRKIKLDNVDEFTRNAIRRIVHQFFFKNEIPTVDKILNQINSDPDLPNFKRTSFHLLLKKLKFQFQRRGRNSMLTERDDIRIWRREFLKKIRQLRNEKRKIYYLDETWVNAGHTRSKVWCDTSVVSSRQAFLEGLSVGLKNPSGKGKRLIVCGIGSEDGFVPGTLWTFESKKSGDYHEEMDGRSFEEWFQKTLLTLEDKSVIVLDNAPYHSRKVERVPTTASKKAEIIDWLRSKNISFEDSLLKVQLLAIVKEHKKRYDQYIVDEMAKRQNKIVLRLPPYHCELNPIELVEPKMWELDNIIEVQQESIIINLDDDSSTDSLSE